MCDSEFFHAHTHSRMSFKDGLNPVEENVERAAQHGQPGYALTDHGVLFGAPDLFKACEKHNIKGVIGMEVYEAEPHEFDIERDGDLFKVTWAELEQLGKNRYYHLTLWALNETGWRNLCALHTQSWSPDYHPTVRGKPLVDRASLARHSEGLMIGLGCIASKTNQALLKHRDDEVAYQTAKWYTEIAPGRVVMEVMANTADQQALIRRQRALATRLGIPVLATNDVHYRDREDGVENGAHHALVKSRAFKKADTEKTDEKSDDGFGQWYGSDGFYVKSAAEMLEMSGIQRSDVTNTTAVLLDAVSFDFSELPTPKPPIAPIPQPGENPGFDAWLSMTT